MTSLAVMCPRLALARDQRLEELYEERAERMRCLKRLAHLEYVVAHRELQVIRAYATGKPKYIAARVRKLEEIKDELAGAKARARRAGVIS
jgi:hypothetical protein